MKKYFVLILVVIIAVLSVMTVCYAAPFNRYYDQDGNRYWCNSDVDGCWVTGENGEKEYIMFWSKASRDKIMGEGSNAPIGIAYNSSEMPLMAPPTAIPLITITPPPVTATPATETPVTETPATETPVTETPATETPATETPVTETPVTGTPVTETPATETPVTETPVTETPVTTPECTKDEDCGTGEECNEGKCVAATDTCPNKPCEEGYTCVDGKCEQTGCTAAEKAAYTYCAVYSYSKDGGCVCLKCNDTFLDKCSDGQGNRKIDENKCSCVCLLSADGCAPKQFDPDTCSCK